VTRVRFARVGAARVREGRFARNAGSRGGRSRGSSSRGTLRTSRGTLREGTLVRERRFARDAPRFARDAPRFARGRTLREGRASSRGERSGSYASVILSKSSKDTIGEHVVGLLRAYKSTLADDITIAIMILWPAEAWIKSWRTLREGPFERRASRGTLHEGRFERDGRFERGTLRERDASREGGRFARGTFARETPARDASRRALYAARVHAVNGW
jgi:hypothetical protein